MSLERLEGGLEREAPSWGIRPIRREGVPGMVLFRPVLGVRGSFVPSVLNVLQLVGWTAVEYWAMGRIAGEVSQRLFGFRTYPLWLALAAVVCTLLALGGPVLVVRR